MANIALDYLRECIEKDKENIIEKIEDINILKELYQTYLQYYSFFNSEFDSFTAKLSNLGTLVTVLLGFLITIITFLFEHKYFETFNIINGIGIFIVLTTFVMLIYLLILICSGQSFKKFLTLQTEFPLKVVLDSQKDSDEKIFYRKMVFCLYKSARTNYHNLEENKGKFPNAFKIYIACVILSLFSLLLICIGGIL